MMPSLGISTSRIKKTTLMSVVLMTTLMMMAMNMKEVNGQQTTRTCYVGHAGSGAPGCGNTSLTPCNTIAECLVNMSSDTQIIINSYSVLQGAGFCGITNVGANTTYSLTISGGFSQVYCPSTFFISWVVGIQQYVTISNLRLNQCTGNSQGCISVLSSIEAPQIMDSNNVGFLSLQSVTIVLSSNRGVYTGPGVNLDMLSCSISGNPWMYSPQGGCALASWNATLQFSQFSSCSAQNGGAIYVGYALTTSSNTFSYNSAQYYGGAIYLHAPMSLSMYADQMFSNTANQVGGAIAVGLAEIPGSAASVLWSFNRVSFFDNTASYAGALSLSSNTILVPVTVNSGYFNQNTGSYLAGGIFTEGCNLTIINSYFESNMAEYGSGGAIEVNSGSLAVNYCDFFDNKARGSRGAAINSNSQTVVSNSFFENNVAQMGAAISFYSFSSNLIVLDSSFDNNAAEDQGGAIYLYGSQLSATDCQFSENSAASGGALYIVPSQITQDMFAGSTFTKNKATYYGGAIYFENFDYEGELFTLPPMSHNTAKSGGAIYYEGFPPAATGIMGFNSAPQIACLYDDACPSGKKVSSCSQCSCLCAMGAETICYDNC